MSVSVTEHADHIVVRQATGEDINELVRAMPLGDVDYHRIAYGDHQAGRATYLVAVAPDGVGLLGHLLLQWDYARHREIAERYGETTELVQFAVREADRGKGYGTAMVRHAERLASQRGRRQIYLAVDIDNPRAKQLYERLGYRDSGVGEVDNPYLGLVDGRVQEVRTRVVCLVKDLKDLR